MYVFPNYCLPKSWSSFQLSVVKPKQSYHSGQLQTTQTIPWTNQSSTSLHIAGAKRGKTRASYDWFCMVLPLIGWKSGACFLSQSCSVVMQDQLLFDTQMKTALKSFWIRKWSFFSRRFISHSPRPSYRPRPIWWKTWLWWWYSKRWENNSKYPIDFTPYCIIIKVKFFIRWAWACNWALDYDW